MGREASCTAHANERTVRGKALLETTELVFRGDGLRLAIPFAHIRAVAARGEALEVRWRDGTVRFDLGAAEAARWAERIKNPRGRTEKLGIKAGTRVAAVGPLDPDFVLELRACGADVAGARARGPFDVVFFAAQTPADLARLATLKATLDPAGALWVVRAKGAGAMVTESAVMAAARGAGLVDVKVVAFSATHTAEKLVIPVADRPRVGPKPRR